MNWDETHGVAYPGEPDRWDNGIPANEEAVRCYMEAAWEFYMGFTNDVESFRWQDDFREKAEWAAAVDAEHRYTLEREDIPGLEPKDCPLEIKTHY